MVYCGMVMIGVKGYNMRASCDVVLDLKMGLIDSGDVLSSVKTEREPKPGSSELTFGNRLEEEEEAKGPPLEEAPLASKESMSEPSGAAKKTSRLAITSAKRVFKKSRKPTILALESVPASRIKSSIHSEAALAQLQTEYQIPSTVHLRVPRADELACSINESEVYILSLTREELVKNLEAAKQAKGGQMKEANKGKWASAEGDSQEGKSLRLAKDHPTDVHQNKGGLQASALGVPRDESTRHLATQKFGSSPEETIKLTKGPEKETHASQVKEMARKKYEGDSVFESTRVARTIVEESRLPLDMKHESSIAGDVHHQLETANIKILAGDVKYQELKDSHDAQAATIEEMVTKCASIHQELSVAQDKANGAEGALTKKQQKLQKAEGELCQDKEMLCNVESDLKKTLKDSASDYFKEVALYLRPCLDEQGVVVDYSIYLSFAKEAEDMGGAPLKNWRMGLRRTTCLIYPCLGLFVKLYRLEKVSGILLRNIQLSRLPIRPKII
ncbi:hypothetical protein NE237_014330 [Protea cynaroides]|uniref:Uncharacterized protein n=1 Tax=Protea cynaroides TaxID=273540 RepID=A0A9Q0KBZ3_9MAGN|nr:hypothetical protein NE237_014330 [Protea cynaroides]